MSYCCELHAHDEWSLLDGVATAAEGARRAAELGHIALAKTNHAVLSGVMHHTNACHEVGIMPIIAVEAYYRPNRLVSEYYGKNSKPHTPESWEYFHMVLIAKDLRGWRSLKLLTSESYRSGWHRYPCIDDALLDKWSDGIFISTSCISGYVPRMILRGDHEAADAHMNKLDRWVGDDWYFELQPHDFDDLRAVNLEIPKLAVARSKSLVATKDAHFPSPDWHDTQKVSVMMRTKQTFNDLLKAKEEKGDDYYDLTAPDTCYIGSADDTRDLFRRYHSGLPEGVIEQAIDGPEAIVSKCTPFLFDRSPKLPKFKENPEASYEELRRLVFEGLKDRGHRHDERYEQALEKELKIYKDKGICDFFLITHDFVSWARSTRPLMELPGGSTADNDPFFWATAKGGGRQKRIEVGIGRGSAGGCVAAYALRITTINPIAYKLKFERFLNPNREGLPDIDLDFPPIDVDLVKEYIKRKHGPEKVYDMIAHGTLGARAAMRRVSTVYDIPFPEINAAAKMIDDKEAMQDEQLPDLRQVHVELDRYFDNHPDVYKHAVRLQGQVGSIGEHAAGVVVADRPLDEIIPVMKKSVDDDYMVTAFGEAANTQIISKLGLLKLDLLVVYELARHVYAVSLIERFYDKAVDLEKLPAMEDPYDVDQPTMVNFSRGINQGVWQLGGSPGIVSLTKKVRPENIEHLSAINAIYRPAVLKLGVGDQYVQRRHDASKIEYWDPSVIPSLEESLGLMIYQEQVMDIFVRLGGFTPTRADDVRRIMSKWYRAKGDVAQKMLGEHYEDFVSHATTIVHGGRPAADAIWNFNGGFCEYSFNKSHAAAYALMAYEDMWLKTHYPMAFYAALLSFPPSKIKKPEHRKPFYEKTIREARLLDVRVLPPDVNDSGTGFTITQDGLRFGLTAIKGLGDKSVAEIIERRPFTSWQDLEERTQKCNAAGRRALGSSGALDRWGVRAELTEDERIDGEQDRLGIALSVPDRIGPLRDQLEKMIHTESELDMASHGDVVVVGGEIIGGKEVATKRGPSLKIDVAFGSNEYRASFAPWAYNDYVRSIVNEDKPVVIRGTVDRAYNTVQVDSIDLAENVVALATKERA